MFLLQMILNTKLVMHFSSAVTADKDLTAPEQVKNLSFTATNNSITLNWTTLMIKI